MANILPVCFECIDELGRIGNIEWIGDLIRPNQGEGTPLYMMSRHVQHPAVTKKDCQLRPTFDTLASKVSMYQ